MKMNAFLRISFSVLTGLVSFLNTRAAETPPGVTTPPPALSTNDAAQAELLAQAGKRNALVHDPSTIVKCKDEFWLFNTGNGIESWHSTNLVNWQRGPRVFTNIPAWRTNAVPGNRGHLWAPDVIHLQDRYLLYYSVSTFGKNTSALGLVTNPTLDPADPNYAWTDQGLVIQSTPQDDFNCIDPAVSLDANGGLWLAFGSFWGGIKLIQLDPVTGKRLAPDSPVYPLAHFSSIEAAYVYPHDGRYYLFVNWGMCCRGINSTYNMRVGRSDKITGPYRDKNGMDLLQGGGTLVMDISGPFIGPGHAGIITEGGTNWLSCHFYDGTTRRGTSMLALRPLTWDADGWPVVGTNPVR